MQSVQAGVTKWCEAVDSAPSAGGYRRLASVDASKTNLIERHEQVNKRDPSQKEFIQAVDEVVESLDPVNLILACTRTRTAGLDCSRIAESGVAWSLTHMITKVFDQDMNYAWVMKNLIEPERVLQFRCVPRTR